MNYAKPEIVVLDSATRAIQGTKPTGGYSDSDPRKTQTQFAYESDE